jgi:hypothetical protein
VELPQLREAGPDRSTQYVASLMRQEGLPAFGHDIGEQFAIGPVRVEVTPADHAWQNASPGASDRIFQPEDCCGFWLETRDGTIWAPGDSRLIHDHHLRMPAAGCRGSSRRSLIKPVPLGSTCPAVTPAVDESARHGRMGMI